MAISAKAVIQSMFCCESIFSALRLKLNDWDFWLAERIAAGALETLLYLCKNFPYRADVAFDFLLQQCGRAVVQGILVATQLDDFFWSMRSLRILSV